MHERYFSVATTGETVAMRRVVTERGEFRYPVPGQGACVRETPPVAEPFGPGHIARERRLDNPLTKRDALYLFHAIVGVCEVKQDFAHAYNRLREKLTEAS